MKRKILPYNPKLKDLAKANRRNLTRGEAMLWSILKGKQMRGYDFDRQRPILNYIVDFYCKDLMIAIEVDGSSHDGKIAEEADAGRQQELEKSGVHFIRVRDEDVREDINSIYHFINEKLEEFETEHKDNPFPGRIPNPNQPI